MKISPSLLPVLLLSLVLNFAPRPIAEDAKKPAGLKATTTVDVDFLGDDFEKKPAVLPADRPLIVHCAAGNRSAKAVAKLAALHKFTQIFHLKSGFNGWKAAGKPVETKPAAK